MILDTNVVSEPLQVRPNEKVVHWLDSLDRASCYITTITAAELLSGVERLPVGKRRSQLQEVIEHIITKDFAGRVLAFDLQAARHFAVAIEKLRKAGRNGMSMDIMIAAIAKQNKMTVASRDTSPFLYAGLAVINPWTDEFALQPGR